MNAKCNVKQSNLPLLFTNGSPTSLESMSLQQLQSFLLFLLKCESGHEISSLTGLEQPKWWPADVLFHDEIIGTSSKKGLWSSMLRKVIQKCYVYHDSHFLLDFSRRLMDVVQQNNGKVTIVDNGDGTRSMKSVVSEKLLVTFKSENQDYDKRMRQRENSFSTHSPMKGGFSLSSESNSSDPRLPLCSDLYLCDICGDDFESLQEVLAHEKNCEKNRQILPDVPSNQTEANKSHYLNYLKLGKNENQIQDQNQPRVAAPSSVPSTVVRPKPGSYAKFLSIDVSSPLGQYINDLTKSASDSIDIKALCQMERKTAALRSSYGQRGARRTRFPVTFRGPKDRQAQKQSPHQYCFTREQFRQRIQTLKTGLSPQTLQLFKRLSKRPPEVKVERLQFKNYPNVDPEEVQRILEKDRAVRLAQRVAAEKLAAERAAAAKASQQQQAEAAALQSVIVPKLLIPSPFKPKAVTTMTHHFSPQPKAEYDNSFYHSFMYANHPSSNGNYSSSAHHQISKYVSVPSNGNLPSKIVECIDLSSTDDEEDEIEIDDPEDDDDDVTTLSDFEDDENLAMAIKRVPGAASAVLGLSASDPLRII